ncbi:hypothetical protein H0H81_007378 [Sphagnurus paluster]|uniref:DHHA2 domain-containing protein n=1 Tax=Sphagnurus paluster TaxID=117069 RepID=A0A9P7GRQ0_9AGAR|nr:hypothetical protein H0H81_007378 [Sphagnurus paluster]
MSRNPIRRLSLAVTGKLKLGSSSAPVTPVTPISEKGAPSTSELAKFLSETKARYLSDINATPSKGREWTVAMGNEAGGASIFPIEHKHISKNSISILYATDLDTVASSIAFAWVQSEVHKKPTIPLLQLERADLDLRAENIYALQLAGITKPKDELLFLDDIKAHTPFPSASFILVDHNRLGAAFTLNNPDAKVIAVVDHHADEGLYEDANPRLIAPAGSCASHVATLMPPDVPASLATLLLTAILIDTNGLKPGGKAIAADIFAAGFLASRSTLASELPGTLVDALKEDPNAHPEKVHGADAIRELTEKLRSKKEDVGHLSGRDLLRRDYKEYEFIFGGEGAGGPVVRAGLSSVPVALKAWGKKGVLEKATMEWMKERGLVVLGVLTAFKDGKKHRREMAWVVYNGGAKPEGEGEDETGGAVKVDLDKVAARLWKGLEDSEELKVKKYKNKFDLQKTLPEGATGRTYKQGNADANRKVVAPLLKSIIEAPEVKE